MWYNWFIKNWFKVKQQGVEKEAAKVEVAIPETTTNKFDGLDLASMSASEFKELAFMVLSKEVRRAIEHATKDVRLITILKEIGTAALAGKKTTDFELAEMPDISSTYTGEVISELLNPENWRKYSTTLGAVLADLDQRGFFISITVDKVTLRRVPTFIAVRVHVLWV